MSSSPTTPHSVFDSAAITETPPSSPPSEWQSDAKMEAMRLEGISDTMREEEQRMNDESQRDQEELHKRFEEERKRDLESGQDAMDTKFKALEYLLSQSKLYSTIMLSQMQRQEEAETAKDAKAQKRALKREEAAEREAQASQRRTTRAATGAVEENHVVTKSPSKAKKTQRDGHKPQPNLKRENSKITQYLKKVDVESKAGNGTVQEALEQEVANAQADGIKPGEIGVQNLKSARQPELVTGGTMRQYQLEGLEWLTSLYENGLNGILADEMGLGKTLQTISFLAFLRERGTYGPFLIAAPLSTTNNWVAEFNRWAPSIPAVLYHGSIQEREEIRRKRLKNPGSPQFPVICTSYEICMNDRKHLAHFGWKFIIIDEGHRIKNLNCRLIRELQSYQSANRLLITGTPLQNNLAELWSLLHFLMPDIFDKLESFESWFDFSALKERNGYQQILNEERKKSLVTSLHAILKPFLLRRVKADVESSLPKKREYILYAPLTAEQRELYHEILNGNSRAYLEEKVVETLNRNASGTNSPVSIYSKTSTRSLKRKAIETSSGISTPNKSMRSSRASTPGAGQTSTQRSRRSKKRQSYEEVSDRAYFKQMEEDANSENTSESLDASELEEQERAKTLALAKKQIAQKKLQNPIMQLRLCCNSPHNFYDPFNSIDDTDTTPSPEDYHTLVTASGKMRLLDQLLTSLLADGHKILIFSQFKTQLDLIALYLTHVRNLRYCRIDGSVANADRQEQIRLFNEPARPPPAAKGAKRGPADEPVDIFLLTTRAGGQGINLAAADTVLLFDSDWNPQQDLQAQDRAHRIGQRRNVLVYRFATRGTVEEVLLGKAEGKRRLEKLVIRRGGLRQGRRKTGQSVGGGEDEDDQPDDIDEELRGLLGRDDGERLDLGGDEVLSEEDLRILTDRSDEAYVRAEKGLDVASGQDGSGVFRAVGTKRDGEGLLEGLTT